MTAWATRAPQPGRTVYIQPTGTEQVSPTYLRVFSKPWIHEAHVRRADKGGLWKVTFPTMPMARSYVYADMSAALNCASDVVGRKAAIDLHRFTGAQRYAMGQRRCPYLVSPGITCDQVQDIGTVWCSWHPHGKERKDMQ